MLQDQYFDSRTGRRLRRDEACDARGVLRDGCILRTPMTARDGMPQVPRFTDTDLSLNRPGFRTAPGTPLADTLARDARHEAYCDYDTALTNAWRKPSGKFADAAGDDDEDDDVVCLQCAGTGEVNNRACPACNGEGYLSAEDAASYSAKQNDKRSVAQQMQDHKLRMASIYDAVNRDLEQEWRKK
jgi:hypothetical protein